MKKPYLKITDGKGFHISFENGWTVSVQIGGGNYSDNYKEPIPYPRDRPLPPSTTAEIAAWDQNNNWHIFGKGENAREVDAYVPIGKVLKFINMIARKKNV